MKNIFFCAFLFAVSGHLFAQTNNVGIGTNVPANKLTVSGNGSVGSGYTTTIASANGIIIQGAVGIGTTSPQAKLHVNGNMILDSAKYYSGNNAATLVRDNTTGEIKVIATSGGNTKPLSYLQLNLNNCNGDWVNDFDTKIPAGTYTLAIIGESFKNPASTLNRISASGGAAALETCYNSLNVYAFQSGGTWHIFADYAGGTPVPDVSGTANGNWIINCLVVNNSLIKTATAVSQDLAGGTSGSASTPPTGF